MKLKEACFGSLVIPWMEDNLFNKYNSLAIEFKKVDGMTFNIKAWKNGKQQHQYTKLKNAVSDKGVYYKIPDLSKNTTPPFDSMFLKNCENAFLIVWSNKSQLFYVFSIFDIDKYGDSVKLSNFKGHKLTKRENKEIKAW